MAQKSFVEKEGYSPWKENAQQSSPILEQLKSSGGYLEVAIVDRLLRTESDVDESVAVFLCHLVMASRLGHLCINISEDAVRPDPEEVWLEGDFDYSLLREAVIRGAEHLPHHLVTCNPDSFPTTPLCQLGSNTYLQRFWLEETQFINHFQKILNTVPNIQIDETTVCNYLSDQPLLEEQRQAIVRASQSTFTLISGGPGTGKTYTAGYLIKAFWKSMSDEQRKHFQIAIAAPTGKAGANLQSSLNEAMKDLKDFSPLSAKTLHALLKVRGPRRRKDDVILGADLILVDESSMIDVRLMGLLLKAIKPGARLVLLGDHHQLPPIEAGSLFADAMHYLLSNPTLSQRVAELKTCLRTEQQAILDFARSVNIGDCKAALHCLEKEGLLCHPLTDPQSLLRHAAPLFEETQKFRILSPLRKGPFGVDAMNTLFVDYLIRKVPEGHPFVTPIMLVSNDYRLELFNGEVGMLYRHGRDLSSFQEGDYALFPNRIEGTSSRRVPALLLPKFEYAYCMSVHKSQGSEFDHVLLLMPEGAQHFGREVLYTAITRARHKLEVWGSHEVLEETISRQSHRLSGVRERFG